MKRRPAWFYEWTPMHYYTEWPMRAVWVPRGHPQARGYRLNLDSIVVRRKWREGQMYAAPDAMARQQSSTHRRRTQRIVWHTMAWIPRIDVETAARAGIPCALLADGTRNRRAAIEQLTPQRCAEVLVALDAWLEQSPTI